MQVRTYTSFWSTERKLYAIQDVTLPTPVPLKTLGVFTLAALPWGLIMGALHVPFGGFGILVWLGPPVALAWFGSRPNSIFDGKTLFQWLRSRALYMFTESKRYKGFEPNTDEEGEVIVMSHKVFVRKV